MQNMPEAVIDSATKAHVRAMLLDACVAGTGTPTVYAMAGIPGAGKTTFMRDALARRYFPQGAFILNPDLVMECIPAYHADHASMGPEDAFLKWEMPARTLAYELVAQAGAKGVPIIKDMGLVRAENWRILMDLRAKGYKIIIHHIICDVNEAVRRCATRERHFPAQRIYERARELDVLMAEFAGIADKVYRFNNTDIDNPFVPLPSQSHSDFLKTA